MGFDMKKRYKRMLNNKKANHRRAIKASMKPLKKFQNTLNIGLSEFKGEEVCVQTGCLCLIYGLEVPSEVVVDVRSLGFEDLKGQNGSFPNFLSIPDALFYKKNILHGIFEAKNLFKNPVEGEFTDTGAISLIQKLKNQSDIKDIIKEILNTASALQAGNSPVPIKNKWEVEVLSSDKTDGAFPLEIRDSSKNSVATLHQLDLYLLALYACDNIKYVIWTNGLCWKIWTKDASGNIDSGLANSPIKLDKDQDGYVKNAKDKIEIDPDQFVKLLTKLRRLLSTLL